jgi:hypothetical protein
MTEVNSWELTYYTGLFYIFFTWCMYKIFMGESLDIARTLQCNVLYTLFYLVFKEKNLERKNLK